MKDTETRRLEMFIRVREYGTANVAQFPPTSFAGQRFVTLGETIESLETHASAQDSGRRKSKQGVTGKSAARMNSCATLKPLAAQRAQWPSRYPASMTSFVCREASAIKLS